MHICGQQRLWLHSLGFVFKVYKTESSITLEEGKLKVHENAESAQDSPPLQALILGQKYGPSIK